MEPCVLVLIAPHSPRQSWYPVLLELLADIPRRLPIVEDMLTKKKRSYNACKPGVTKSCSLQNYKSASSKRKLSPKAQEYIKQARRASTKRMYLARLTICRSWCDRRHVSPFSACVEELAIFFSFICMRKEIISLILYLVTELLCQPFIRDGEENLSVLTQICPV
jgi:hypothetical protein